MLVLVSYCFLFYLGVPAVGFSASYETLVNIIANIYLAR